MFFTENKPSTEPFSFIFIKKLCSFALVITTIFYTYNQFSQFVDSIANPNLKFYKQSLKESVAGEDDINIIGGVCGPHPIDCTYNDDECKLDEYSDHQIPNCYYYAFNFREKAEIKITPFINEIYLDGLVINNEYYSSQELFLYKKINPLLIINEQINIVYYSFTISKRIIKDYVYGLAGGVEKEFVDFFTYTDHIAAKTSNVTTLVLMPISMELNYQEESYYDRNYQLYLSNIFF
jgi:hypothetical protein